MVQWGYVVLVTAMLPMIVLFLVWHAWRCAERSPRKFVGRDNWVYCRLLSNEYDGRGTFVRRVVRLGLSNWLGFFRLAAGSTVMTIYLVQPYGKASNIVAIVLWALAFAADVLDGRIARKYGMITAYGATLDVVADKAVQYLPTIGLVKHMLDEGSLYWARYMSVGVALLIGALLCVVVLRDLVLLVRNALTGQRQVLKISKRRAIVIAVALLVVALHACVREAVGQEVAIWLLVAMAVMSFLSLVGETLPPIRRRA